MPCAPLIVRHLADSRCARAQEVLGWAVDFIVWLELVEATANEEEAATRTELSWIVSL